MDIAKKGLALVALAAASCQSTPALEIGVPGARPIAYETIRDASGVLGYAESLLGPDLATEYEVPVGPGASAVERSAVAGAWELPPGTQPDELADALRAQGALDEVRDRNDGQLWFARYKPRGGEPVRLMLINGAHPAFETNAVPEVRPGPHVYLIAYRKRG